MDFNEYIARCQKDCSERIDTSFFEKDARQTNAIRSESLRDQCTRCGLKATSEALRKDVKKRGWGIWIYSGGSPSAFAPCEAPCPLYGFFIRTAPRKEWRTKQAI